MQVSGTRTVRPGGFAHGASLRRWAVAAVAFFSAGTAGTALAVPQYSATIHSPGPLQVLGSPSPVSLSNTATNPIGSFGSTTLAALAEAGPGLLRGASHATLALTEFLPIGWSAFAQESSNFLLDNIVIAGPAGSTSADVVTYSINLAVSGSIGASASGPSMGASASVNVRFGTNSSFGGFGGVGLGSMTVNNDGTGSRSGIFSAFPTAVAGTATAVSPTWQARAGDIISISMILDTSAVVAESFGGGPGLADAFSDFSHTAMFSTSGPLFNLADGWTVNSLDGCIADNHFVCGPVASVSAPPGTILLVLALAGLLGTRARR